MLLLILAIVIALVAWSLRLMEQAVKGQEFSLMLAGFLVASSAAAMMAVYFLMGDYLLYIDQASQVQQFYEVQSGWPVSGTVSSAEGTVPNWLLQE